MEDVRVEAGFEVVALERAVQPLRGVRRHPLKANGCRYVHRGVPRVDWLREHPDWESAIWRVPRGWADVVQAEAVGPAKVAILWSPAGHLYSLVVVQDGRTNQFEGHRRLRNGEVSGEERMWLEKLAHGRVCPGCGEFICGCDLPKETTNAHLVYDFDDVAGLSGGDGDGDDGQ